MVIWPVRNTSRESSVMTSSSEYDGRFLRQHELNLMTVCHANRTDFCIMLNNLRNFLLEFLLSPSRK